MRRSARRAVARVPVAARRRRTGRRRRGFALKWPNDVLLDGAKLAGILLEAEQLGRRRLAVVIGIGVNCRRTPPEAAVSGRRRLPSSASPVDAARVLFARLSDAWAGSAHLGRGRGFAAIRSSGSTAPPASASRVAVNASAASVIARHVSRPSMTRAGC